MSQTSMYSRCCIVHSTFHVNYCPMQPSQLMRCPHVGACCERVESFFHIYRQGGPLGAFHSDMWVHHVPGATVAPGIITTTIIFRSNTLLLM